ncbi:MAG: ROK family protein [Thermoplasmata archaeon]
MKQKVPPRPRRILILDIGGTHVRVALTSPMRTLRISSGPTMDPQTMLRKIKKWLKGERYDAVSVGYPGVVLRGRIVHDPANLGKGWVGFDFRKAFGRPTQIVNDAAMQALGSYEGGKMLFLGLGTGLGTAMILDGEIEPMELGHLPYKKGKSYEDFVGERGRRALGRKKWSKEVFEVVKRLSDALEPDYVVLGGGNVRKLKVLPPGARRGDNRKALVGGARLWTRAGVRGMKRT